MEKKTINNERKEGRKKHSKPIGVKDTKQTITHTYVRAPKKIYKFKETKKSIILVFFYRVEKKITKKHCKNNNNKIIGFVVGVVVD